MEGSFPITRRNFVKLGLVGGGVCLLKGPLAPIDALALQGEARASQTAASPLGTVRDVVLEDFTDVVTQVDFGFNDFSGNTGPLTRGGGTTARRALPVRAADCGYCDSRGISTSTTTGRLSSASSFLSLGSQIHKPPSMARPSRPSPFPNIAWTSTGLTVSCPSPEAREASIRSVLL